MATTNTNRKFYQVQAENILKFELSETAANKTTLTYNLKSKYDTWIDGEIKYLAFMRASEDLNWLQSVAGSYASAITANITYGRYLNTSNKWTAEYDKLIKFFSENFKGTYQAPYRIITSTEITDLVNDLENLYKPTNEDYEMPLAQEVS